MRQDDIRKLIGKLITGYTLSPSGEVLTLHTANGEDLKLNTYGDCCSETWIEHVTTPAFPATITAIDERDLGEVPGVRQEYGQKYSTVFRTDKGNLEVEYRNDSNGYYGGSLEFEPGRDQ